MAFFTSSRQSSIRARITRKETSLTNLYVIYDSLNEDKEHRFDSGEGSQRTQFRDIDKVGEEIRKTEKELDALYRKLNGTGVVNINLRRSTRGRIL